MKYLGYGGVGDCLIIILKLLEQEKYELYTHIESTKEKLLMCGELLNIFNINFKYRKYFNNIILCKINCS